MYNLAFCCICSNKTCFVSFGNINSKYDFSNVILLNNNKYNLNIKQTLLLVLCVCYFKGFIDLSYCGLMLNICIEISIGSCISKLIIIVNDRY